MNASIEIQSGILNTLPQPEIKKYFNNNGTPYTNVAEVMSQIPLGRRHQGLTVNVAGVEYWWATSDLNIDPVIKTASASHTHSNKAALDQIGKDANNNPTWNNGAWPGGGSGTPGISVTNATINGSGHLIITLSDNTTIDAGVAVGPQGAAGAAGATGNGIASSSYNASTGVLTITYTSGGTYSTGDLRGAAGQAGAAGSKWYNGAGAPLAGTGVSGDYYLNTTNGDVYVKTSSWALSTNIKGPTGATGATGASGATWLSGSSAPTTQGVNGDFYLNTTTYDVSLKTAGTWNVVVNIKGPIGNTGATGATGATGKGISSITLTNTVGQTDTYTITYTDGSTTTFNVVNGANYTHPTGDGNLHVPATTGVAANKVLTNTTPGSAPTWETPASVTPADNSITNAKLSKTTAGRIKGSKISGDGSIEDLTVAEVVAMLGLKKELLISKPTFNSIAEPGIYKNGAVAKQITGFRLMSNATGFKFSIGGTEYTEASSFPVALGANTEMIIMDVVIANTYSIGNVILIIE